MEDLSKFAHRPLSFMARYVRRRPVEHTIILTTVVAAVGCSIGTQYGVKFLVDTLSQAGGGSPCRLGRICAPVLPHRRGQPAVARGELRGERHVRARHRTAPS